MKKINFLLGLILLLCSCSNDSDKKTELPLATQTGENTAGCLVNGKIFLPKGSSQFGPTLSCFYQQDFEGFHVGLSLTEKGDNENKSVGIAINLTSQVTNSTYQLIERIQDTNNNYTSNFGQFIITSNSYPSNQFYTTNSQFGEIKITKLDTQQKIISGTFWFDALNSMNEKVEIREGRFDMRYVN